MRCPACNYVCSELRDLCPHCLFDTRPHKKVTGLPITNAAATYAELLERTGKKNSSKTSGSKSPHSSAERPSSTSRVRSLLSSWSGLLSRSSVDSKPYQSLTSPSHADHASPSAPSHLVAIGALIEDEVSSQSHMASPPDTIFAEVTSEQENRKEIGIVDTEPSALLLNEPVEPEEITLGPITDGDAEVMALDSANLTSLESPPNSEEPLIELATTDIVDTPGSTTTDPIAVEEVLSGAPEVHTESHADSTLFEQAAEEVASQTETMLICTNETFPSLSFGTGPWCAWVEVDQIAASIIPERADSTEGPEETLAYAFSVPAELPQSEDMTSEVDRTPSTLPALPHDTELDISKCDTDGAVTEIFLGEPSPTEICVEDASSESLLRVEESLHNEMQAPNGEPDDPEEFEPIFSSDTQIVPNSEDLFAPPSELLVGMDTFEPSPATVEQRSEVITPAPVSIQIDTDDIELAFGEAFSHLRSMTGEASVDMASLITFSSTESEQISLLFSLALDQVEGKIPPEGIAASPTQLEVTVDTAALEGVLGEVEEHIARVDTVTSLKDAIQGARSPNKEGSRLASTHHVPTWRRAAATLVDHALVFLLCLAATSTLERGGLPAIVADLSVNGFHSRHHALILTAVMVLPLALITYHLVTLLLLGGTLGTRIFSYLIVTRFRRPLKFNHAVVRSCIYPLTLVLGGFAPILAGRSSLADLLACTTVVYVDDDDD